MVKSPDEYLKTNTKPPKGGRDYSHKINNEGDNMKKYLIKKVTKTGAIEFTEYFGANCTSCTNSMYVEWFASFAGYDSKEFVEKVIEHSSKYTNGKLFVEEVQVD